MLKVDMFKGLFMIKGGVTGIYGLKNALLEYFLINSK